MFDDSLMESAHKIRAKSSYWSAISVIVNAAFLVALIVWPLLHPLALPREAMNSLLVAPSPPPAPPPVSPVARTRVQAETLNRQLAAPSVIRNIVDVAREPAAAPSQAFEEITSAQGNMDGLGDVVDGVGRGPAIAKPAEPRKHLNVSSGVLAGNLISQTMPQYPAIARAAHISGIVELAATISTSGAIENLRVLNGPPMLQQAAMEAVRSWRYRPFLLNGAPVEVESRINVVFNLGQ
jgi:periplasmic protein TonB